MTQEQFARMTPDQWMGVTIRLTGRVETTRAIFDRCDMVITGVHTGGHNKSLIEAELASDRRQQICCLSPAQFELPPGDLRGHSLEELLELLPVDLHLGVNEDVVFPLTREDDGQYRCEAMSYRRLKGETLSRNGVPCLFSATTPREAVLQMLGWLKENDFVKS